jgi:hypothetical protein
MRRPDKSFGKYSCNWFFHTKKKSMKRGLDIFKASNIIIN